MKGYTKIKLEITERIPNAEIKDKGQLPPILKVNQKGVKFITGDLEGIRKSDTCALRKTRKRLW